MAQLTRRAGRRPGLHQHHLDLGVGIAQHLGHSHLQALVLGLRREGVGPDSAIRPRGTVESGFSCPHPACGFLTCFRKWSSSRARYRSRSNVGSWVNDTKAPATGEQVNAANPDKRGKPAGSAFEGRGIGGLGMLTAERAALSLRQEGVLAGGLGAAAAQGLQQRRADPRQRLGGDTEVNAGKRRGSHAPQRVRGDPRAVPSQGSLTSALPQTQPDASVQAWEPTLSAPDPWKRRRPSREARKAVRSSSRVNVCR